LGKELLHSCSMSVAESENSNAYLENGQPVELAKALRRTIYWAILILLLFVPMFISFASISDLSPIVRKIFPLWENRSPALILSDMLFAEAACFLVLGAMIAGVTLYNSWASLDVRKVQFTDSIWNWKRIKEERDFPSGLLLGSTLLAVGIIYLASGIIITL